MKETYDPFSQFTADGIHYVFYREICSIMLVIVPVTLPCHSLIYTV